MSELHSSFTKIDTRPPTAQEEGWIREIVLSNPTWADVQLGEIRIVAECHCGCHSVVIEEPRQPQNPKFVGHQGLVGEIDLTVKIQETEETISVLLHYAQGSFSLLEVVWYNFPDPIPSAWTEISRRVLINE